MALKLAIDQKLITEMGGDLIDVTFSQFQTPSAAASERHKIWTQKIARGHAEDMRDDTNTEELRTGHRLQGGETFYHGSNWTVLMSVLKMGALKADKNGRPPIGLYALRSPEQVKNCGYDLGVIFYFAPTALDASNKTRKNIKNPQPGVCFSHGTIRAAPEWVFEETSITLLGALIHLNILRGKLTERETPRKIQIVPHNKADLPSGPYKDAKLTPEQEDDSTNESDQKQDNGPVNESTKPVKAEL